MKNTPYSFSDLRVVVIDNYDSFTYNIVHLLKDLGVKKIVVLRNDQFQLSDLESFDKIILSPGPGIPSEAGLLLSVIERYASTKSILGICLGEQAIGEFFGAKLENLSEVYHGIATPIEILKNENGIFKDFPSKIQVGRYHSWVVSLSQFPDCLEITASSEDGCIMALKHRKYDVQGVQFHPESVLTPEGKRILFNFLKGL